MRTWISLFCFFAIPLCAAPELLRESEIHPTMQEIFAYHVEQKKLTPQLVKRSFKMLLELFDPEKIYLTQEEVSSWLSLSEGKAKQVVERYEKQDFSDYKALSHLFYQAILRAHAFREEAERALIIEYRGEAPAPLESYLEYASSEKVLKERVKKQIAILLAAEAKRSPARAQEPSYREKIFALWNRRFHRVEAPYILFDDKGAFLNTEEAEHNFCERMLKALAQSLDAHTAFFTPEEAFEMRASLEKEFEGVGVILREEVEGVVVEGLVKGGPAEQSGQIAVGDVLIEINGDSLEGISYEEILEKMKGEGSRKIRLGLRRGEETYIHVNLQREKIRMDDERVHTSFEPFADGIIGKIVLPAFYESSENSSAEIDLKEAIKSLKQQGKLHGLVLDFRENLGGFLSQAVKVAGLFITSGVIVISKYAEGEMQYLRDIDGRLFYNGPLVILTSQISASAAEIVAQALQDYGSAIIVGDEHTYGKGSIQYQTVTDDQAKAFYKVTVGRYYTVSGRSTQIEGVKADIVVPTKFSIYEVGERYLEYPLSKDHIPSAYVDPLVDVDPKSLKWFQKNYLPHLQKKNLFWTSMLPMLKKNSAYRLQRGPNYKLFLEALQRSETAPFSVKENWGVEDLQMTEGVSLLKDMIIQSVPSDTIREK